MASLRATHGSERIRSKLTKLIESREYYEAHQLYRTLHFRYINCARFSDLENLLYDGAILLLDRQQHNSGADLAILYIDTLSKDVNIKEAMKNEQEVEKLSKRLADLLSRIPADTPERLKFTAEALKLNSKIFPMQRIRHQFALIFWKERNYADARRHFLHCSYTSSEDCALMLIEYHTDSGYKSEADLFIAQFILQLLCIKSGSSVNPEEVRLLLSSSPNAFTVPSSSSSSAISSSSTEIPNINLNTISPKSNQHAYANLTLQYYLARHPLILKNDLPFPLPLVNFLWFLLLAIEEGKVTTFNVLLDKYGSVLSRDPAYKEYLQRIGELYFGLRPVPVNRGLGGFLGNFLQSFMEDNEEDSLDEDETNYHPSAPGNSTSRASGQQSATSSMTAPPNNSNRTTPNSRTVPRARHVPQESEDLD